MIVRVRVDGQIKVALGCAQTFLVPPSRCSGEAEDFDDRGSWDGKTRVLIPEMSSAARRP